MPTVPPRTLRTSSLIVAALVALSSGLAACDRRPADPAAPSTTPGATGGGTGASPGGTGSNGAGTTTSPMPPASAASR